MEASVLRSGIGRSHSRTQPADIQNEGAMQVAATVMKDTPKPLQSHARILSIMSDTTTASMDEAVICPLQSDNEEVVSSFSRLPATYSKLPVRSTFIHFSTPQLRRSTSSPCSLSMHAVPDVATIPVLTHARTRSLPTVGSAGHALRKCKPCAFFWKEAGCQNGTTCEFCHLCDADEKKIRGKGKVAMRLQRRRAKLTKVGMT